MEIWKHCWNCKHETPQKRSFFKMFPRPIEGFVKDSDTDIATSIWSISIDAYQFCECKKCEAPLLHIDTYQLKNNANNFEKIPLELQELNNRISSSGHCHEHEYISLSYPNFNSNAYQNRKWSFHLPVEDMSLFFEVISAYNKGLFILALSGIRTIIDRYIVKKIGDSGSFKDKLKKMLEQKYINQKQFELLDTVIEAGNAAGHRGFRPEKEMLDNLLMVVEDIISLEYKTFKFDEYKQVIPKRTQKNQK